jgi:hypothetical protein
MVYKESPFCSQGSAFGLKSTELLLACLINLLSESFGALSVLAFLQHFWGPSQDLEGSIFTSSLAQHPQLTRRAAPVRHYQTKLIQGRSLSPGRLRR